MALTLRLPWANTPAAPSLHAISTLDLTRARPQTAIQEDARVASALFKFPQRRGVTTAQARGFADTNPMLRAALNRVKDRVARAEHAIVPADPDRPFSTRMQGKIAYLIENPNPRGDSWRSFIEPVLEDVCVLGKGGWEYVPNWRGWPVALYPYDAVYMSMDPNWDGSKPNAARYYWTPMPRQSVPLRNDECTMLVQNPRADRPEGLGWVDTLYNVIAADSAASEYVRSMLQKYPPPGWFHLGPSAGKKQVDAFSEKLSSDVYGNGAAMVTGGMDGIEWHNLHAGNSRDNQLKEWALHFGLLICMVAGVSPQDIGLTMDINKATADVQERIGIESGYKSVLLLVQEYINREVIGKFGVPESINLKFQFKELTQRDRKTQIEIATKMAGGLPVALYNEARAEADLPPLALGNAVYVPAMGGAVAMIGDDADAYRRQAAAQIAKTVEDDAAAKIPASGNEKATDTQKQPAQPDAGGAGTAQQDDAAANQKPKGAA